MSLNRCRVHHGALEEDPLGSFLLEMGHVGPCFLCECLVFCVLSVSTTEMKYIRRMPPKQTQIESGSRRN